MPEDKWHPSFFPLPLSISNFKMMPVVSFNDVMKHIGLKARWKWSNTSFLNTYVSQHMHKQACESLGLIGHRSCQRIMKGNKHPCCVNLMCFQMHSKRRLARKLEIHGEHARNSTLILAMCLYNGKQCFLFKW